jgi:uncharacterized membrane protein YccC
MEDGMTENPETKGTISDEFRRLGDNLRASLQTLWDTPEASEVRDDIKTGLAQLGETLNQLADELRESQTGKRVQAEVEEFAQRVRSGEVEAKLRQELVEILGKVNIELEKAQERISREEKGD